MSQSPTSYPNKQPHPASWGRTAMRIAGVAAGSIAAILGLIWLATHVDQPDRRPDLPEPIPVTVGYEVVAIWLHPEMLKMLNDPAANDALRSYEAFYQYVAKHKLEHTWSVVVIRHVQSFGPAPVTAVIRQPHDNLSHPMDPLLVLNAAAGRPPQAPLTDYSRLKVGIIPAEFVGAAEGEERRRAAEQLMFLEPRPLPGRGAGAAPSGKERP